jgi:hypothetical protein
MSADLIHAANVVDSLSIVKIRGFEPDPKLDAIEPPGTPGYLVEEYGAAEESPSDDIGLYGPGILWTDYDLASLGRGEEWDFAVLIDSEEIDRLKTHATKAGYKILSVEPVTEPTYFGDDSTGIASILKHWLGWVVLG